jgi:hypothetical protein
MLVKSEGIRGVKEDTNIGRDDTYVEILNRPSQCGSWFLSL